MNGDVWQRLSVLAPVSPRLAVMLSRFDHLGLDELGKRLEDCHALLREWAARPKNHRRPVHEEPCHLERVALGALLERRLWWE